MKTASMFLSEMSVVDHAWIDESGQVRGGSFNPSFLVHGPVDPVEKVVVDFSTVKKSLKGLLDHDQTGFDHKLWLIRGVSKADFVVYEGDPESGSLNDWQCPEPLPEDPRRIRIQADGELDLPLDAVKILPNPEGATYGTEAAGHWMATDLGPRIETRHPGVRLDCHNSTARHVFDPSVFDGTPVTGGSALRDFRYVHGLRDSTSWGCQNIAHGHLSFVQLVPDSESPEAVAALEPLAEGIAEELGDAVFVRADNVVGESGPLEIGYSCPRGHFRFVIGPGHKVIRLETETTIEFLVDYVFQIWGDRLREAGCRWLFLSEGLTKGASVDLGAPVTA